MYRWLLQLSTGTGCKYSLLFFSMLVQFAPIPFWNMVVNMNAFLAKLNVSVTVAFLFLFLSPLWALQLCLFIIICVCECMFVWRRETHRHCTGWLFSWFIIINHCNDSFIPLVVMCVSCLGESVILSPLPALLDRYSPCFLPSGQKTRNIQAQHQTRSFWDPSGDIVNADTLGSSRYWQLLGYRSNCYDHVISLGWTGWLLKQAGWRYSKVTQLSLWRRSQCVDESDGKLDLPSPCSTKRTNKERIGHSACDISVFSLVAGVGVRYGLRHCRSELKQTHS